MSSAFGFDNHYRYLAHTTAIGIIDKFELNDLLEKDKSFIYATNDDLKFLKREISNKGHGIMLKINENNIEEVIKCAYPLRNEKIDTDKKKLRYFLAHYTIAKISLEQINKRLNIGINELYNIGMKFKNRDIFKHEDIEELSKLIFQYEDIRGICVNLIDVLRNYEERYCDILEMLGVPNAGIGNIRARIYEFEFTGAIETLFYSRNPGRHVLGPIIRTLLEIMVWRLLFDKKIKSKFDLNKLRTNNLYFKDVLKVSLMLDDDLFRFGSDSWKRIYEWGNMSVHKGIRHVHSEMWFSYLFCLTVKKGMTTAKNNELFAEWRDKIIERLISINKIILTD